MKLPVVGRTALRQLVAAVVLLAGAAAAAGGWVPGAGGETAAGGADPAFPGRLVGRGPVVSLQVVAHSDHPLDQAAKLAVRDAVLPVLRAVANQAAALGLPPGSWPAYLEGRRPLLEEAARHALARGPWPSAPVRVEVVAAASDPAWPAAASGGWTVRVVLGKGRGHNWWCVAFPFLCPGSRTGDAQSPMARASGEPAHAAGDGQPPGPMEGPSAAQSEPAAPAGPGGGEGAGPWWLRWWSGEDR